MEHIQKYMIFINLILLMCGTTSVHLGCSFLKRERNTKGFFKFAVFLLALGNGLCSIGYSVMSLSPSTQAAYVSRLVGLLGIDIYIVAELILITSCLNISRLTELFIILIASLASALDLIIYGSPDATIFYHVRGSSIYINRDPYRQVFHYSYQIVIILCFLIIGFLWATRVKYRRDKRLVLFIFLSNLIFAASSIPDLFLSMRDYPFIHVFYCFGIYVAFIVFYISANDYMAFYITINSISKDIFSTLGAGLLVFDTNYHLNLSNEYANKLCGLDKEPYRIRLKEIFELESGEPMKMFEKSQEGIAIDYRLIANVTGKVTLVNFSCKTDRNNEPLCYILIATDLTEENRLIEEAQSANAAKSNFLSNISHEIRTPINVITGMNELILRECEDKNILKYAENINVASRNLTSLINDVLDFSKIESGKLEIVSVDFSIGTLLNDLYNLFLSLTHNKQQSFSLNCNPDTPNVLVGDEVRLKQIVSNLLSNAVKYTPEYGKILLEADFEPIDENSISLIIHVKDNGFGIKEEDIPKLFNNFQRLELNKNRTIQGTGLGLAITKNLVTLMHGTITVDSVYGEGSSFTVTIPFGVSDNAPVGEIKEKHDAIGSREKYKESFLASEAKILAVDDVQMNLDVFTGLLKRTGVKIECASSGYEALDLMKHKKYDLIFLDHMMPELDGIEVLKRIRSDIANRNYYTPVIMLTANAMMGADRKYLDDGFDDYLSKPIQPSALENMVVKHLPDALVTNFVKSETTEAPVAEEPVDSEAPEDDWVSRLTFLDTASGIEFAAGDKNFYRQILETYIHDDRSALLEEYYQSKDWPNYQIAAHSVKGTSLTIGAKEVSEAAKGLEFAVKEDNLEYIDEHHEEVLNIYKDLIEKLKKALQINT